MLPVLRERGLAQREYAEGTLREKLFGAPLLNDRHPASQYRGAYSRTTRDRRPVAQKGA